MELRECEVGARGPITDSCTAANSHLRTIELAIALTTNLLT
jgi:hypothetical protein